MSLALRGHLAVVLNTVSERRCRASLAAQGNRSLGGVLHLEQIVSERQRSGQQLPASAGPILRQFGSGC